MARTIIPSLHVFLEILLRNGPEYDSDNIDNNDPLRMCYHINGDDQVPELTSSNQSPHSRMAYL
jgi:hypothetical protein